jgi:hypothetical protein
MSTRAALLGMLAGICVLQSAASPAAGSQSAGAQSATDGQYSEDAVKAVFLYRFTSFVDWPAEPAPPAQFAIAVLDADGVADALGRLLPAHQIKERPAVVRKIARVRDLGDARILYVGAERAEELTAAVAATAGRPVLLVSGSPRALERGSAINFLLVDQRIRFEVSLSAANRAGLKISSELLSVAIRVVGGGASDSERPPLTRMAEVQDE